MEERRVIKGFLEDTISKAIVKILGLDVSRELDGRRESKKGCGNKAFDPGAFYWSDVHLIPNNKMAPTDDDYFLRWKDVVGTRNWVRKSKLLDQKVQAKIVWYRRPSWWNERVLLAATGVLDRAGLDLDK